MQLCFVKITLLVIISLKCQTLFQIFFLLEYILYGVFHLDNEENPIGGVVLNSKCQTSTICASNILLQFLTAAIGIISFKVYIRYISFKEKIDLENNNLFLGQRCRTSFYTDLLYVTHHVQIILI